MNGKKRFRKMVTKAAIIACLIMVFAACSMTDWKWGNHAVLSSKRQTTDEQAVNRFIRNIRTQPGNPDSHNLLANYYLERGKYQEAINEFNKVLSIDPNYVKAYNGRGISFDELGENAKAVENYRMALRLDAKLDYVLNNLCYSLAVQGNPEEAIQTCKQALFLNKNNTRIRNNLAMAYAITGNYEQAYTEFETAANGDKASAHLRLAAVCYERANFQIAANHYAQALSLNPSSDTAKRGLEASQELIKIVDASNRYQERVKAEIKKNEELVRVETDNAKITDIRDDAKALKHLQLADKLYEKKAFKEAQIQYQQAIALNPTRLEARKRIIAAEALARITETSSQKEISTKAKIEDIKNVLAGRPLQKVGIEVCNGNGRRHMARDVGAYLNARGFNVVRLTNARNFNYKGTGEIYYENEYGDVAANIAEKVERIKTLQQIDKMGNPRVKVKVLLGKDLIAYRQDYRN